MLTSRNTFGINRSRHVRTVHAMTNGMSPRARCQGSFTYPHKKLPGAISFQADNPGQLVFSCSWKLYVIGLYLYPNAPPFGVVILNAPDFLGATGPTVVVSVEITVPVLSRNSTFTV